MRKLSEKTTTYLSEILYSLGIPESIEKIKTYFIVKKKQVIKFQVNYVRMKGLEPPRRKTPDPKSGAATNYATSAIILQIYNFSNNGNNIFSNKLKLLYLKRGYLYSYF